jgi:hypothetical protein
MTNEEAQAKWCPFVRAKEYTEEPAHNVLYCQELERNPFFATCIADQCACWITIVPGEGACGLAYHPPR